MSLDAKIKEANQKLRVGGTLVTIERRDKYLWLRGTLPPKPHIDRKDDFEAIASKSKYNICRCGLAIASLFEKLPVILPFDAEAFVEQLPIEKFHGIGEVTTTKMHALGIRTGADLKERSLTELVQHFGKVGQYYYKIVRVQDDF